MLSNCGAGGLLRVPWTARWSNQSLLKEINPEYSLEGLMLKLQYFGYLMQRTDSLEKTLMLGRTEGGRRRGNRGWDGGRASLTQWTWVWASSGSWWRTGKPGVLQSMGLQGVGHDWANQQQQQPPVGGQRRESSWEVGSQHPSWPRHLHGPHPPHTPVLISIWCGLLWEWCALGRGWSWQPGGRTSEGVTARGHQPFVKGNLGVHLHVQPGSPPWSPPFYSPGEQLLQDSSHCLPGRLRRTRLVDELWPVSGCNSWWGGLSTPGLRLPSPQWTSAGLRVHLMAGNGPGPWSPWGSQTKVLAVIHSSL